MGHKLKGTTVCCLISQIIGSKRNLQKRKIPFYKRKEKNHGMDYTKLVCRSSWARSPGVSVRQEVETFSGRNQSR